MRKLVVLAAVCSFLAIPSAWAWGPIQTTRIEGVISTIDADALQLVVDGTTVQVTDKTIIQMRGRVISFTDLAVGQTVAVCGVLDGATLVANRVTVKYGGSVQQLGVRIEGTITVIDVDAMQIVVDGVTVKITDDTLIMQRGRPVGFDALEVGQTVAGCGVMDGETLLAQRLTIKRTP